MSNIIKVRNNEGEWISIPALAGADGITPHIGENGHWFIGDDDTGVTAGGIVEIPVATTDTIGGIKVGDNLTIDENGRLNASASVDLTGYATQEYVDAEINNTIPKFIGTLENPVDFSDLCEGIRDKDDYTGFCIIGGYFKVTDRNHNDLGVKHWTEIFPETSSIALNAAESLLVQYEYAKDTDDEYGEIRFGAVISDNLYMLRGIPSLGLMAGWRGGRIATSVDLYNDYYKKTETYSSAETDAKISEAIDNIEIPDTSGVPKFVGTEENPIDFSNLFEGIEDATYHTGFCILGGYFKATDWQGNDLGVKPWSEIFPGSLSSILKNIDTILVTYVYRKQPLSSYDAQIEFSFVASGRLYTLYAFPSRGFIAEECDNSKIVTNTTLADYYKKTETYSNTEVDTKIEEAISNIDIPVVVNDYTIPAVGESQIIETLYGQYEIKTISDTINTATWNSSKISNNQNYDGIYSTSNARARNSLENTAFDMSVDGIRRTLAFGTGEGIFNDESETLPADIQGAFQNLINSVFPEYTINVKVSHGGSDRYTLKITGANHIIIHNYTGELYSDMLSLIKLEEGMSNYVDTNTMTLKGWSGHDEIDVFTVNGKSVEIDTNVPLQEFFDEINALNAGIKLSYMPQEDVFRLESIDATVTDIEVSDEFNIWLSLGFVKSEQTYTAGSSIMIDLIDPKGIRYNNIALESTAFSFDGLFALLTILNKQLENQTEKLADKEYVDGKISEIVIPTKVSELANDANFINNTVNNLTNYYTRTETYTQTEVNDLINAITTLNINVVTELPTTDISTTTIYLKSANSEENNVYEEWLYVNGKWELIGTTAIDLTPYATKVEVESAIKGIYIPEIPESYTLPDSNEVQIVETLYGNYTIETTKLKGNTRVFSTSVEDNANNNGIKTPDMIPYTTLLSKSAFNLNYNGVVKPIKFEEDEGIFSKVSNIDAALQDKIDAQFGAGLIKVHTTPVGSVGYTLDIKCDDESKQGEIIVTSNTLSGYDDMLSKLNIVSGSTNVLRVDSISLHDLVKSDGDYTVLINDFSVTVANSLTIQELFDTINNANAGYYVYYSIPKDAIIIEMEDITKTSITLNSPIWSSLGLESMDNTNERFKQGSNQTVLNITQPDGIVIQNITLNESGFDFAGNFALSQILRNTDLTSMKTYTDTKVASVTKSSLGLGNVENKSSATIRGELTSANVTTALGFTPTSLALGETSTTAYRGDRGKTAYDHSQVKDGTNPHATTFANIASKPTTISGYGITDAKIANGVVTLGANTITPLTASSSLDATKLTGTASISTTGNAKTATTANALKDVTATATELNYVKGVTSNIQTQLNAKASSSDVVTLSTNQTINADKTVNGYLKVKGTADERHLITRGIGGCSEDCATADDLYINYGQDYGARFGKSGQGQLKSDGSIVCTNINGYTIASNVPANAKFTDTTYSAASTSAAGLMSAADKTKLDGIATGANKYTLPVATSSALGGIKSGTDITVDSNGNVSVNDNSHNHNASNISAGTLSSDRLPTVPITKGGTGATTAAAALTNLGLTATATELNYVDGVTSNIQTQLNAKATITKYTATIPATGWTATAPFYVDVTVSGITANDAPNVTVTYSGTLATDQARKDSWNKIDRIVTSANSIRVYAFEEVPTTAVPIQLVVVR